MPGDELVPEPSFSATHLDSTTTVDASAGFLPNAVPSFAPATRLNDSTFVDHLGRGRALVAYIVWAT
jgi:hypothetical protein